MNKVISAILRLAVIMAMYFVIKQFGVLQGLAIVVLVAIMIVDFYYSVIVRGKE